MWLLRNSKGRIYPGQQGLLVSLKYFEFIFSV